MAQLISRDISRIFTIPTESWTAINKRVGVVLAEADAQQFISTYLPGYPALLNSSRRWQGMIFRMLTISSQQLSTYCGYAKTNFEALKWQVQLAESGRLSLENLRMATRGTIDHHTEMTGALAQQFERLSKEMLVFLHDNQEVDREIMANKDKFGDFWKPIGEHLDKVEVAAGLVTGCWRALQDDLLAVRAASVDADLPFIESLKIDAALVLWQAVQQESDAFSLNAKDQEKYWLNPFEIS